MGRSMVYQSSHEHFPGELERPECREFGGYAGRDPYWDRTGKR